MASDAELTGRPLPRLDWNTNNCYVCGLNNPGGMQVRFTAEGDRGARAEYTAREEHCGWPGLLHGGVAFTLMDEALAYALYFQKLYGVTAKVETRFRQPVPAGTKLVIRAWSLDRRRRLIDARAEIRIDSDEGALVAEADATMYLQEIDAR